MIAIRGSGRLPAVAGLAALALLAGCADDNPQSPPTTTAAPPSPTASPAPTAVPSPTLAASATPDVKGAEVFVRYFWDTFNYAYATGDTKPLRAVSGDTCKFCAGVAKGIEELHAAGGSTAGGVVAVDEVLAVPPEIAKGAIFTLTIDQSAGTNNRSDGRVIGESPAISGQVTEMVLAHEKRWRVFGVDVKPGKGE